MDLNSIETWQRKACPKPDARALSVALGVHLEELAELLQEFRIVSTASITPAWANDDPLTPVWADDDRRSLCAGLEALSSLLKTGTVQASIADRRAVLDAIADGIVTGVGVGWRAGMNVPEACAAVDESNWSKFVEGEPVFDSNGKVRKGPHYLPPNLEGYY